MSLAGAAMLPYSLSGAGQGPSPPDLSPQKVSPKEPPFLPAMPDFYGSLELRHSTSYYYQQKGLPEREAPDLRLHIQAGAILYGGHVDAFITTGAIRYPLSQRVFQKRPEAAFDIYPVKSRYVKIRQYHRLKLPFEKRDEYLRTYDSAWEERADADGSVYTIGINPWAEWPESFSFGQAIFKGGIDIYTYMYSKPVYKEIQTSDGPVLTDEEDHKPMIGSRQYLSASYLPSATRRLKFRTTLYFHSHYYPVYRQKNDRLTDNYSVRRFSGYRIRASISLTRRMTLINDFYHYHSGFFSAKRSGPEKRFKNILRITTLL